MLDALDRYDPDPLRYYLTVAMPETRDSDWTWEGFVTRNNTELVANWGNLVNRVFNMTGRYFDGVVPEPGRLTELDLQLLDEIDSGFDQIGTLYNACKFRAALQETMTLATKVNQYLEDTKPWKTAKDDLATTARSLNTAIQAINGLKMMFAPVLPHTSQQVHELLGEAGDLFGRQIVETYREDEKSHIGLTYDGSQAVGQWERVTIQAGRQLPKPKPLFKKLDPSLAEEELQRLEQSR
jgi:methionyl-tRNA synthetase